MLFDSIENVYNCKFKKQYFPRPISVVNWGVTVIDKFSPNKRRGNPLPPHAHLDKAHNGRPPPTHFGLAHSTSYATQIQLHAISASLLQCLLHMSEILKARIVIGLRTKYPFFSSENHFISTRQAQCYDIL